MTKKALPYILFYIGAFLLGFFGLSQIIVLKSVAQKIPYIILVAIGYPILIGGLIWWMRKEVLESEEEEIEEEKQEIEPGKLDIREVEEREETLETEDDKIEKEECILDGEEKIDQDQGQELARESGESIGEKSSEGGECSEQ